jgi:hypothetical protein
LQILSTTAGSNNSTNSQPTSAKINNPTSSLNITNVNPTASDDKKTDDTRNTFPMTTVQHSTSNFSEKPTDQVLMNQKIKEKKMNEDWWFILVITAFSCIMIVALVLFVLAFRHKRKTGVWFKGLLLYFFTLLSCTKDKSRQNETH